MLYGFVVITIITFLGVSVCIFLKFIQFLSAFQDVFYVGKLSE